MLTTVDHIISLLSSAAIATAVLMLVIVRIPQKMRWEPMSRARWILVVTFSILALSGLLKIDAKDAPLLSTVTLCVASYQALLFTHTASIMLAQSRSSKKIVGILGFISVVTCLLFVLKLSVPKLYPYAFYAASVAYIFQLVVHTMVFRRDLAKTVEELENYYDENVDYHLRPIKKFYYSALGIGVLAGVMSFLPIFQTWYNVFVLIYTVYYVYVVMAIMNYCIDGDFFLVPTEDINEGTQEIEINYHTSAEEDVADNAITEAEESAAVIDTTFEALEQNLDAWVKRKEFTKVDINTDEVAEQLNVTRQHLIAYFKTVHNTTFRSWRQQLRLEYACCLIRECPDQTLAHLHEQVGFNDRSNFYTAFRKYTGTTLQEYKDSLKAGR